MVGDQGVGKTCFIRCLIGKDISAKYEPTVDDWYTHHILTKGKVKLVSLTSELVKVPNKKKHIITVDIASKKMVFMNEII